MPTLNIKDVPESKIVKLVDLSEDSINKIAEAVAQKIADPVKHGHWVFNGKPIEKWSHGNYCSVCGEYSETCGNYCPYCGAEMDDVEDE